MTDKSLNKLLIKAFPNDKYEGDGISQMYVQTNPDKYALSYQISLDKNQPSGSSKKSQKTNKTHPEKLSLELHFDSSGMIPLVDPGGGQAKDIPDSFNLKDEAVKSSQQAFNEGVNNSLERLRKLMLEHNGEIHRPNSIMITWGELVFKGRLTQLDIEYKLFRPNGIPIRAIARCNFEGAYARKDLPAWQNNQSPDLTQYRTVSEGDRLPLMANDIYQDPLHFFEVARANGLVNFRTLKTGQQLRFPPFAKA